MEPHFAAAALVTIDVQVDTLDGGPLEIPGTSAAVPAIDALCGAFREARRPIVHMIRLYTADGANAEPARRGLVSGSVPILRPGSLGRLLAPGVLASDAVDLDDDLLLSGKPFVVGIGEVVMYKPRWGAFFDTALEDYLRRNEVDTVVVCGCNYPNCPRASVYEASERDFRIVLVDDAVSGVYDLGRQEMETIGVSVMPTAEVVSAVHALTGAQQSEPSR